MANIQKYGAFEIDGAEEALAQASKGGGGAERWKPHTGQNAVRFLPPMMGKKSPFAVQYQHWITTPDGQRRPMNCARMMMKQRCACCEKMDSLQRTGNAADFDAAQGWKPKLSVSANLIDRLDESKGVQVYSFGKSVLDQLVSIRKDTRGGGDFTDPEDGFDILIDRRGEALKTEYTVRAARDTTPLHDDSTIAAGWLDNQYDLDRYLTVPSYDEQLALLGGEAPRQARDMGRVNAAGERKPEVLPPASGGRRRSVADDTEAPF